MRQLEKANPAQPAIASSDRSLPLLHFAKIDTGPVQGPCFRLRFPRGRLGLTDGGTDFSVNRLG